MTQSRQCSMRSSGELVPKGDGRVGGGGGGGGGGGDGGVGGEGGEGGERENKQELEMERRELRARVVLAGCHALLD